MKLHERVSISPSTWTPWAAWIVADESPTHWKLTKTSCDDTVMVPKNDVLFEEAGTVFVSGKLRWSAERQRWEYLPRRAA